jgi:hypothetical protein
MIQRREHPSFTFQSLIFNQGNVAISRSTVSSNHSGKWGGGIFNHRLIFTAILTMSNSTVSLNSSSGVGDGISNFGGELTISSSTIAGNNNNGEGLEQLGTAYVKNSIIENCINHVIAAGVNFDPGVFPSCPEITPVTAEQLRLGPLADNDGLTWTRRLLPGSIATDAAADCTDAFGKPVVTDQRGVPRRQGPACDVGACERRNPPQ